MVNILVIADLNKTIDYKKVILVLNSLNGEVGNKNGNDHPLDKLNFENSAKK